MIQSKTFGVQNCSHETMFFEATKIDELMVMICEKSNAVNIDTLRSCAVIVNDVFIMNEDRVSMELKDGDDVLILLPIIGG
ncbi:MAG: MoaD/ThiS family protein [Eubacteriaceae bacterium]|nr:MoaD/ThiS family protein [Eubacteriaceae bacterium]